jgi:RNA polymerase sigma factor (sigma-70 family)
MGSVGRDPPNEEMVGQLCRAHEVQLLRHLTRLLGQPDVAREVAQDAYEKLHKVSRSEVVMFPRAMLFTIATRFALMRLRSRRRWSRVITGSDGIEEVPDDTAGPCKRVMVDEIRERLVQTITELGPELRTVFVMAYVQGKPHQDIAEELDISPKSVGKRMTRALEHCRKRLASLGIDPSHIE